MRNVNKLFGVEAVQAQYGFILTMRNVNSTNCIIFNIFSTNSFILTMRNVNSLNDINTLNYISGFILTMRNVNEDLFIVIVATYVVLS